MTDTHAAIIAKASRLVAEIKDGNARRLLERTYMKGTHEDGVDGGPYQWQVDFHNAGGDNMARAILAGNRVGKSRSAAAEIAVHATGMYPPWWTGRRFDEPVSVIIANETSEMLRDINQEALVGKIVVDDSENKTIEGTGWIPSRKVKGWAFRQGGVVNVIDTITVEHVSGGESIINLKSYEQGYEKFQGVSRHIVWLDEEPTDNMVFSESLMRILDKRGLLMFTRTPLYGATPIVQKFTTAKAGSGYWYKNVTWDDAPHLDLKAREMLLDGVPDHEKDARSKGIPMLGSGAVYPISPSQYVVEPFPIPAWWRRIAGIDFGINHPAAAAWIAYDADLDVVYVYDCWCMSNGDGAQHIAALRQRGEWIPVAWPHDGLQRDKWGGVVLAEQYRDSGANLLLESARYEDDKGGGQPREPATHQILERMKNGQFKVFSTCVPLLAELRMIHRKDGRINPVNDDIESAVRYAVMSLRFAETKPSGKTLSSVAVNDYDPFKGL